MAATILQPPKHVAWSEPADIEITVYTDLSGESDAQLREAFRAAKLLESMGFVVVIVPVTVGWDFVSHDPLSNQVPVVQVNGSIVSEGRVVKAEEIVAKALASISYRPGSDGPSLKGDKGGDGEVSVNVAA